MARIKSNFSQVAFDHIKNKINSYDLKPGDTVSDLNISAELEMSRTPIKEAILQLVRYGLIVKERTKFTVVPITKRDITEILEIRETMEQFAIEKIISRGGLNNTELAKLLEIETQLKTSLEKKDYNANFKLDALFHKMLIDFSGNERAIKIIKEIHIQGERLRWLSMLTPDRYVSTICEHDKILETLKKKDIKGTQENIIEHIQKSRDNYFQIIENNKNWEDMIVMIKQAI